MLEAVLFDWGDTLVRFEYDAAYLEAGHRDGLEAIGREGLPGTTVLTERFRGHYEPLFWQHGMVEEVDYPGSSRVSSPTSAASRTFARSPRWTC